MPRALAAWLRTLAGAAILAVLLWRLGTGPFLDGLRRIDAPALLGALAIGLFTTVFSAWRWCLVARGLGLRLPLRRALADYYRALFLNAALPGGVLGDVHRAVGHGRSAGDLARGVRAVVLERAAGQAVLCVVGVLVLLAQPSLALAETQRLFHTSGADAAALVCCLLLLAAVGWLCWGPATSRRRRAVLAACAEARDGLLANGGWHGVILSSVAVLAGYLGMFLLAARVAGSTAPLAVLVPLMVLALLAMALPLNVGGWGPREGVAAWSFGAAGLGAAQGLAVAVVYGVLTLVASLPGIGVLIARGVAGLRPAPAQIELPERVLAEEGAARRGP
ncbi:lysylphosphatidylglycerol synthase transmembrane domain-containing protein [Streptomyces ramulosus]